MVPLKGHHIPKRTLLSLKDLFIYLVLAVLGLFCCVGFSLVAESGDYSLAVVLGLHLVSSLAAELKLEGTWVSGVAARGLSCCGSQALERRLNSCGTRA